MEVGGNSDNFKITNNHVHHNNYIGIDVVGRGRLGFPNKGIIKGNICHHNGIPESGCDGPGIYIDGAHHLIIEDNICYGNLYSGINVNDEGGWDEVTHHIIVRRNTIYDNRWGLYIGSWYAGTSGVEDCIAVHNTVYNNGVDELFFDQGVLDCGVKNNIFFHSGGDCCLLNQRSTNEAASLDYNCWYPITGDFIWRKSSYYASFPEYQEGTGQDTNSIADDPLFVDQNNKDFRLQSDSPCVNRGGFLTKTSSSGTGTVIPVEDARYFTDGFGVIEGDWIQIDSNDPLRITNIDYDNNVITVDWGISWDNGNGVSYFYSGSAPDIGAYEYNTSANNIYYVDASNGDDSNPGTEAKPWLTIQKAANTMVAGDMVYIKEGIYNEQVIPQNSGSPGNYITYIAYPGDTVTIDGTGIPLSHFYGVFEFTDKSYIKVSGLRVINSDDTGILAWESSHIIFEKNYVYNTVSSGIAAWYSNNISIDDNEVELACNGGAQECITVAATDGFEVKNNNVHLTGLENEGGEGIDAKQGSSNGKVYNNHVHNLTEVGIYIDAWDGHEHDIDVYQNIVHDCTHSGICLCSEAGGLLENVNVYNNIIYDNDECGIRFGDWSSVPEIPVKNIKVINNNLYNNGLGVWGGGISVDNSDAEDIVIRNNICSQNRDFQIRVSVSIPNLTVDHNLIDGYRGYWGEIYGDDYVEGDPLFVNPSEANFHLQADSPAIDNGSSINAPSDDFDGNKRPYGNGYDIGAFEYQGNDDYNLDCNGILSWPNVQPGSVVNGSFTIENVGNPGLEIDWCITEWPSWGTWTFTPISGDNLSPEDGPVAVEVSVVAPDEQNKGFSGSIKIVNKDNIDDFCIVPVSLATPKNKEMISTLFIQFLERVIECFPMLERLLKLPSL